MSHSIPGGAGGEGGDGAKCEYILVNYTIGKEWRCRQTGIIKASPGPPGKDGKSGTSKMESFRYFLNIIPRELRAEALRG